MSLPELRVCSSTRQRSRRPALRARSAGRPPQLPPPPPPAPQLPPPLPPAGGPHLPDMLLGRRHSGGLPRAARQQRSQSGGLETAPSRSASRRTHARRPTANSVIGALELEATFDQLMTEQVGYGDNTQALALIRPDQTASCSPCAATLAPPHQVLSAGTQRPALREPASWGGPPTITTPRDPEGGACVSSEDGDVESATPERILPELLPERQKVLTI